jgi:hypothetical protein
MNYCNIGLSAHQERGVNGQARVRAGDRTPDVLFHDPRTNEQTALLALLSRSQLFALIGPAAARKAGAAFTGAGTPGSRLLPGAAYSSAAVA